MNWSTDDRQRFLRGLDDAQHILATISRILLGIIIVAVIAVAGFVIVRPPWDGLQGEWFYFSIAVLMVLGWAVGHFVAAGHRLRKRRPPLS